MSGLAALMSALLDERPAASLSASLEVHSLFKRSALQV